MRALFGLLAACAVAPIAHAQDATTAGELTTPHPTLEHLSIEWAIDGDDDEDGRAAVRFRETGAAEWRDGHPLLRVPAGSNEGFSWTNRHAGSLFGLRPDTEYEIEVTIEDPDGGGATRTITARTRPVPTVSADAPTTDVTPSSFEDALRDAAPGDVLVLAAGTYASFTAPNNGAEGSPIVVRAAEDAEVVIDGEVRMDGRSDVWLFGLTVRGQIKFNDSDRIVVQGCRVETERDGIIAYGPGTRDGYFADNVVIGPTDWRPEALGASGDNLGEGIAMTGPGNVIAYNRVQGFRDCVSLLEDDAAIDQRSIDIVGNDLFECADDAIEADFSMGNVRVVGNRSATSFIAWSSQPSLGGPTYFVRNVAYANFLQVFKPNRGSLGDVLWHNTALTPGDAFGVYTGDAWGRATARNNLWIGGAGEATVNGFGTGPGRVLDVSSLDTTTSSFDFEGYGSFEVERFDGRFGDVAFDDLAGLRAATSETNAVRVDLDDLVGPPPFPRDLFPAPAVPDLSLADGSAAIDVGVGLPTINDDHRGAAPDLGAYEHGAAPPTYGPRGGAPICGDGSLGAGEECDDGNTADGDGCDASCRVEASTDAGAPASDAGSRGSDGGASPGTDGGPSGPGDGGDGCGCRATGGGSPAGAAVALIGWLLWRRRR